MGQREGFIREERVSTEPDGSYASTAVRAEVYGQEVISEVSRAQAITILVEGMHRNICILLFCLSYPISDNFRSKFLIVKR